MSTLLGLVITQYEIAIQNDSFCPVDLNWAHSFLFFPFFVPSCVKKVGKEKKEAPLEEPKYQTVIGLAFCE